MGLEVKATFSLVGKTYCDDGFCFNGICLGPSANLDLRRLIIERQAAPDILLSGLVTYDDVGKLFDLFVFTCIVLIFNLTLR